MKYLDFLAQTIIISVALISIPVIGFIGPLVAAAILGFIQVLSSSISVINQATLWKWKRVHLFASLGYLAVLVGFQDWIHDGGEFAWALMLAVPVILAIYYYALTIIAYRKSVTKPTGFLRHISF